MESQATCPNEFPKSRYRFGAKCSCCAFAILLVERLHSGDQRSRNDERPLAPNRTMLDSNHCPTQMQLEQFVLGELDESQLTQVAAHADECDACQQVLSALDRKQDLLLGRLRHGYQPSEKDPQDLSTLDEVPVISLSQATTLIEDDARLRRLLARLEDLPDRARALSSRDWMEWLQTEFGSADETGALRISQFRVDGLVGVGGMGIVFDAFDERLQRRIALKFMRPEIATTSRVRERFSIEARAMAIVTDPHVVKILQVGQIGTLPYLTMEFLEGESLGHRLRNGPALSVSEVLQIGSQVAAGLAAAHRCGLIHRDIKPDNIFLTADGERSRTRESLGQPVSESHRSLTTSATEPCVKLLDFGLARSVADTNVATLLDERDWVLGTPAFMSPEQAQALPVDHRTDLFSLGCVLYRLLTGRLPFEGTTHDELLRARLTQSAMSLHVVAPQLPPALTSLIDQLLARDQYRRPASADDVATRLQALMPRPPRKLISRRSLLAAGVIAATGATVGGWRWWQAANRIEPLNPDWLRQTKRLAAEAQINAVIAELRRRNPKWDGRHEWDERQQAVYRLNFDSQNVRDISPLQALGDLRELVCLDDAQRRTLTDISTLRGLQLLEFNAGGTGVSDLSPLHGMPLLTLRLRLSRVANLTPLADAPLRLLQLSGTLVEDLSPVRNCPLRLASFWDTRVSSLEPLRGMRTLERVECEKTLVRDLSPLRGLPIKHLACQESPIEDYSILAELPLEELHLSYRRELHRDLLLSIKTLKKVNYKPVEELLK